MSVFSTGFVNLCPSNLLSGKVSTPPPPSMCEYVYRINAYNGVIGEEGAQTDKTPAAKSLHKTNLEASFTLSDVGDFAAVATVEVHPRSANIEAV
jgi:hypothetical protein